MVDALRPANRHPTASGVSSSRRLKETTMASLNYDETDISLSYEKARELPEETVAMWMRTLGECLPRELIGTIIDMGCGTGRFSQALSDHFSARVYGVDPSWKMLTATRTIPSPRIRFLQGSAESIPLTDGLADLVFLSMVYHHIQDEAKAAAEFKRVLRPGGYLCVRTSTLESIESCLYLQFFPAAREKNLTRLPSRQELTRLCEAEGFRLKGYRGVSQLFASSLLEYCEKVSLRALSDLRLITDDEFREGLARMRKHCEQGDRGEGVFELIDLFVFQSDERGTRAARQP